MFAMHRPGTRACPNHTLISANKGVMTKGAAQITLNTTETLVENPFENVESGPRGPRGKKGSTGKQGPKVLSWSKDIEVSTDTVTSLITFPHRNIDYDISKFEIIAHGNGEVTFYLIEEQTGEKLATISTNLVKDLTVITHEDVVKPASTPAILTLQAVTGENNEEPVKFISFTVTMKKN